MAYTTINKSTDHFNTVLYTGNGSTNAITGVGFQPDWVWIKGRSYIDGHKAYDAVRGVAKDLTPNTTDAEGSTATGLTAFDSDGFTLGSWSNVNRSSETHVSWNWKANGQGSSNTDGSINTTYTSVNTTAGFSISQYTGNESGAPKTVGHGLGVVPQVVLIKNLADGTLNWSMYHHKLGNTKVINLNTTGSESTSSAYWNNTTPTTSVFTVNSNHTVNHTGTNFIAYCFAEKTGYSQFGSYTGNGNADGPFIYTGFKPAFLLAKESSSSGEGWIILDSVRNPGNLVKNSLQANITQAEETLTTKSADFLSNGFKIRTTDGLQNSNGETYIYMAFAEVPLVGTNNTPALAR